MPDSSRPNFTWYCVQTLPKHEHIAAACLRQASDIEVFLPRIRYQRATKLGRTWVTEALFLNYLFARFNLASRLRWICAARGVRNVVHFGAQCFFIPDCVISQLQEALGSDEVRILSQDFAPGEWVEIAHGPFCGLQAVISHALPAKQRVAVLLDFLGRQTMLELDCNNLMDRKDVRTKSATIAIRP